MPNLKDLKIRITSVKSTQKITSAMKMVAAAKLRRAQEEAESARPYAERMERMIGSLAEALAGNEGAPPLLAGTGDDQTHLIAPYTADRGLCGGFNGSIVRETKKMIAELKSKDKTVKIFCIGRKGYEAMKREFGDDIIEHVQGIGKKNLDYSEAAELGVKITDMFEKSQFDVCTFIFNKFKSAMTQVVTRQQIIPFAAPKDEDAEEEQGKKGAELKASYIFEPDEEEILAELLPRNIGVQMFQALLESIASEHGSRMTAMDSATRNAGDMIDSLTLTYNRTRQAFITRELIEIISGAEAL